MDIGSFWKRNHDVEDVRDRIVLRYVIVAALAVSIDITWKLWQVREMPPNLPAFALPQLGFGWLLIVSLVVVLLRPLPGIVAYTVLSIAAMLSDQIRIQPGFISLTILLWGTLPHAAPLFVGRVHLFSLWLYAGAHKLLSTRYIELAPDRIATSLPSLAPVAVAIAVGVAIFEMGLALLLLAPKTRTAAVWLACLIHASILAWLVSIGWNYVVWPWNAVLIVASVSLFGGWKESVPASVLSNRRSVRFASLVLLLMPLGFYVGLVPAYVAHCLYSDNTAAAWLRRGNDSRSPADIDGAKLLADERLRYSVLKSLNVPIPPEHHLFESYFRHVADENDWMFIKDPRAWARRRGLDERCLTVAGEYRSGAKHGLWTHQHQNGRLKMQGHYRHGREHGLWTLWYETGEKETEGEFVDGQMTGEWRFWTPDGRMRIATFDRGEIVDGSSGGG